MSKIAYFDCIAGASGDMILGALLDAGLPFDPWREQLASIPIGDVSMERSRVDKNGFGATKISVGVKDEAHSRHLQEIEQVVRDSALPEKVIADSIAVFRRIGEAEAAIHGTTIDQVHLHEVGAWDTIIDVCGSLLGLQMLGVKAVHVSPLPLGRGFVNGAHGRIPLPAPATVSLLKGVPVHGSELDVELVTPTGAAVLTQVARSFGPMPAMILQAVGYGAGSRDLVIPNVLRLFLGEEQKAAGLIVETLVVLESNIDDDTPEHLAHAADRLRQAGALEVWFAPVGMKKNRPGEILGVLAKPGDVERLREIIFTETSTIGVRESTVQRHSLWRKMSHVHLPQGVVHVKWALLPGGDWKCAPEHEDCREVAERSGTPLREIYAAALQVAREDGPPSEGAHRHAHSHGHEESDGHGHIHGHSHGDGTPHHHH